MKLATLAAAAVLGLAASARAQSSSALSQLDDRGRLVFETIRLEKRLAAIGFELHAARFSIGYDNKITAYLAPRPLKKLRPSVDKTAVCDLLAQYAAVAEKLRQAYAGEDFNEVVEYRAKALLAEDLATRLRKPGPFDARIGDRTTIVRYHDCRQQGWDKMYDDLPVCSDALLSYGKGLITDPF